MKMQNLPFADFQCVSVISHAVEWNFVKPCKRMTGEKKYSWSGCNLSIEISSPLLTPD
jgi:hypothetical protein